MPTYFLTAYAMAADGRLTDDVESFETHSFVSALRWSDERDTLELYIGVQYQSDDRAFVRCESLAWLRGLEG